MAFLAGSPAIHGGQAHCTDAGGQPLSADQRGTLRASPCSIGAFEGAPPSNTALPSINGTPAAGKVLSCTPGTFSGDGTIAHALQWLRDGAPIAGATGGQYAVALADRGHAISCRDTASSIYGSAAATSASVNPPAPPPRLALTGLKILPRHVRGGHSEQVSFVLTGAAKVGFTLARCASKSRRHPCSRVVRVKNGAPGSVRLPAGPSTISWTPPRLRKGSYELIASPAHAKTATLIFAV
jgi:hypothetical protein